MLASLMTCKKVFTFLKTDLPNEVSLLSSNIEIPGTDCKVIQKPINYAVLYQEIYMQQKSSDICFSSAKIPVKPPTMFDNYEQKQKSDLYDFRELIQRTSSFKVGINKCEMRQWESQDCIECLIYCLSCFLKDPGRKLQLPRFLEVCKFENSQWQKKYYKPTINMT